MNRLQRWGAAALLPVLLALAPSCRAQASVVTFASTGTIAGGVDELGLFGSAGAMLDGQAFSLTITIDSSLLADRPSTWPDAADWHEMVADPARAAVVGGAVTVAGHSYAWTVDDAQARLLRARRGPGSATMPDLVLASGSGINALDGASVAATNELHSTTRVQRPFVGSVDFGRDQVFDTHEALIQSSAMFYASLLPGQGGNDGAATLLTYFASAGALDSASWTATSPVPEPRQGALLPAGLGALLLLRLRGHVRRHVRRGAAVLALAAAPLLAQGAVVEFTVGGIVADGRDGLGLFGAPGAALAGKSYTMRFTVDTASFGEYRSSSIHGANSLPGTPFDFDGVLVIDGRSHAWQLQGDAWASVLLGAGGDALVEGAGATGDDAVSASIGVFPQASDRPQMNGLAFEQRIEYLGFTDPGGYSASFRLERSGPRVPDDDGAVMETTRFLGTGSHALWQASPVPEPGQYTMLLAGAAVLALGARRRRR